jgi:hypothetical protein
VIILAPAFLLLIIVVIFAVPAIFQWLWNITCPDVFRLPEITYWQAFRIVILAAILFGGAHFSTQSSGSWNFGL